MPRLRSYSPMAAGRPVPGPIKAGQALDVHVQQRAGLGPLVALERLPRRAAPPREAVTGKDLVDRRAGPVQQAGEATRAEVRALTCPADSLLLSWLEQPRRAARTRAAIRRPVSAGARFRGSVLPAMPPPMRRRDRDATRTRCRTERDTLPNKTNKGQPSGRSELRVSVNAHPGPPDCSSWRNRRDSGRARTNPSAVHNLCGQLI